MPGSVTFILSVVAIVLSVTSLGWQVMSWRLSGAVVKVSCELAIHPGDVAAEAAAQPWYLRMTACNRGRSPVTVSEWGLRLPNGTDTGVRPDSRWSSPLSYRLEPGSEGRWFAAIEDVKTACKKLNVSNYDPIAFIRLGDGRTVDSPLSMSGIEIPRMSPPLDWKQLKKAR
jgi:hypothetical protein